MTDQRKEFDPPVSGSGGAQRPAMSPGDQAPAGTPGTGEDICPMCGGSGKAPDAIDRSCPNCEGTGKVIVGIGGA